MRIKNLKVNRVKMKAISVIITPIVTFSSASIGGSWHITKNASNEIIETIQTISDQNVFENFDALVPVYNVLAEEQKNQTNIENEDNLESFDLFCRYDLNEEQLSQIARLCQQEQNSIEGVAVEASLMANRFELYGKNYGIGADGLYNYVANSKWFANAKQHMRKTDSLKSEFKEVVRKVLVDVIRVLPKYVDEHDCLSDISTVYIEDKSFNKNNNDNYLMHDSIIRNVYGSKYIFYCFPSANSDVFGYTSLEKRKELGDECYSYEDLEIEKDYSR